MLSLVQPMVAEIYQQALDGKAFIQTWRHDNRFEKKLKQHTRELGREKVNKAVDDGMGGTRIINVPSERAMVANEVIPFLNQDNDDEELSIAKHACDLEKEDKEIINTNTTVDTGGSDGGLGLWDM